MDFLKKLEPTNLLALARNESAIKDVRLEAVRILQKLEHPFASHPDLVALVAEIKEEIAKADKRVAAIFKSKAPEVPDAKPESAGAPNASVTTKTL